MTHLNHTTQYKLFLKLNLGRLQYLPLIYRVQSDDTLISEIDVM